MGKAETHVAVHGVSAKIEGSTHGIHTQMYARIPFLPRTKSSHTHTHTRMSSPPRLPNTRVIDVI